MDLRKVKKLIELVEESGIAELEVTSGDESVRIAMIANRTAAVAAPVPAEAPTSAAPTSVVSAETSEGKSTSSIRAPMAGTFYRAPSPEAEAFVQEGAVIQAGDVVCIIESMKMMHEIRAEVGGTVVSIPATNGEPISTGDILFQLS